MGGGGKRSNGLPPPSPFSRGSETVQIAQLLSSQRNWLRRGKTVEGAGAFSLGTVLRYRKRVLTGAMHSPTPPPHNLDG